MKANISPTEFCWKTKRKLKIDSRKCKDINTEEILHKSWLRGGRGTWGPFSHTQNPGYRTLTLPGCLPAAHSLCGLRGKPLLVWAGPALDSPCSPCHTARGTPLPEKPALLPTAVGEAIHCRFEIPGLFRPGVSLSQSGESQFSALSEACAWHTLRPCGLGGLLPASPRLPLGSSTRNCFKECKLGQAYQSQRLKL
uniref:Uncharacterized protein n=1 Tax=Myotis myotis TaxID=51298 RepID=A0A7J7XZS6_MYOMY|nr:hypothetical protein mMyoMyo1_011443 [Myotis myotis]